MNSWSVTTRSAEETQALGEELGALLRSGDCIALVGDLGGGKTRFAKGVALGLGIDPAVTITSPTFTLLNTYQGRLPLYHFDVYRLSGDADAADLGFGDYFFGDGVSLVEWADRLQEELPEERLTVTFIHRGNDERGLEAVATGQRYEDLLALWSRREE